MNNRGYGGQQGRGGYDRRDEPAGPDYKAMTHYYDRGCLKREVFIDWPRSIAASVAVSRTNMRRAYDSVAALRHRIRMDEDPRTVIGPGMAALHRFAEYQTARNGREWEQAKRFIQTHCEAVDDDPSRFEGFYQLFQSVMAYLRR
ncbi:MAG: type III-A CRISPR-associated protein Csm2 [Chthonomonadales bacterium]|nr:type III-A CRISPR-associated protein Csm2 [Chthonomonadales bacterium]